MLQIALLVLERLAGEQRSMRLWVTTGKRGLVHQSTSVPTAWSFPQQGTANLSVKRGPWTESPAQLWPRVKAKEPVHPTGVRAGSGISSGSDVTQYPWHLSMLCFAEAKACVQKTRLFEIQAFMQNVRCTSACGASMRQGHAFKRTSDPT